MQRPYCGLSTSKLTGMQLKMNGIKETRFLQETGFLTSLQ